MASLCTQLNLKERQIYEKLPGVDIAKRCCMYEDALYLNTTETLSSAVNTFHMCALVQSSLDRAIVHGSWLCAKNLENIKDYQLNSLTKERSEAPAKCIFACALYSEIMWFGLI